MPPVKKKPTAAPVEAAQAEAAEGPTVFEHMGIEFVVPPFQDLPFELLEAEDEMTAVRLVIGNDKWIDFRAKRPTIGDFQRLSEKINAVQVGSGN